jgi:hypothetical protein
LNFFSSPPVDNLKSNPDSYRDRNPKFFPCPIPFRKAGGFAKYWIEPVELDFSQGMKVNDLKIAEQLIIEHLGLIKSKWNEVHGF